MTREEIEQLKEVEPYCFETDREEQWYRVGLQEGLSIADANPKSPWISVEDDLPCNYKELMRTREVREGTETVDVFATSKSGIIWSDYMIYENGKWRWNGNYFNPDFWMLAPKLPKE